MSQFLIAIAGYCRCKIYDIIISTMIYFEGHFKPFVSYIKLSQQWNDMHFNKHCVHVVSITCWKYWDSLCLRFRLMIGQRKHFSHLEGIPGTLLTWNRQLLDRTTVWAMISLLIRAWVSIIDQQRVSSHDMQLSVFLTHWVIVVIELSICASLKYNFEHHFALVYMPIWSLLDCVFTHSWLNKSYVNVLITDFWNVCMFWVI